MKNDIRKLYNFSTLISTKIFQTLAVGQLMLERSQELEQQMDLRGVPRHRFLWLGEIPGGGTTVLLGPLFGDREWDRYGSFMAQTLSDRWLLLQVLSGPRHSSNMFQPLKDSARKIAPCMECLPTFTQHLWLIHVDHVGKQWGNHAASLRKISEITIKQKLKSQRYSERCMVWICVNMCLWICYILG